MIWYGTVCHGMVCHGMIWYGMPWYDMVWYSGKKLSENLRKCKQAQVIIEQYCIPNITETYAFYRTYFLSFLMDFPLPQHSNITHFLRYNKLAPQYSIEHQQVNTIVCVAHGVCPIRAP